MTDGFICECDFGTYGSHSIACHDREVQYAYDQFMARQNERDRAERARVLEMERQLFEATVKPAPGVVTLNSAEHPKKRLEGPYCNGVCVMAQEFIEGCVGVAYAHPDCEKHGSPEPEPDPTTRPSWDEWGLALAKTVSTRGDCRRAQHGAVILDTKRRIVSGGYNGYPSGKPGCLSGACPRGSLPQSELPSLSPYHEGPGLCEAVHAEKNALLHGDARAYEDGTIYITGQPCFYCLTDIKGSGLARAVWPEGEWVR
jgi:dCMP deaminase